MNRIEEMIKEMCPEGVKRVTISSFATVLRGKRLTKKQLSDKDKYPVYHGGQEPIGYYHEFNRTGDTVMIINVGASAGTIGYCNKNFWSSDGCYCISRREDVNNKYLYAALLEIEPKIKSNVRYAGIPTLDKDVILNLEIPLPPLPIQQEIVNILDKFTALQQNLEDELKLREKQYEYYREKLLTFEEGECEWKKISEISNAVYAGATPSTKNKEYWENGDIRWMSSGEVHQGQVFEVEGRITQLGYDKCSTKMVPINSIVIALAGQGKTRGTVAITRVELCTNQSICAVVPNNEIVKSDYMYFYLKGQYMNLRQVSSGDGTRGGLNLKMINNYEIPVPSLEKQSQITQTLDRFESLISNLKTEIELRKKQYEYYREKLLTF